MERYFARHKEYELFKGGKHHAEKYDENPIHKWLNNGFMDSLLYFATMTGYKKTFEIGCGEGQLMGMLYDRGYDVSGMDYDVEAVEMTRENFAKLSIWGGTEITQGNLFDLKADNERIKGRLLICCEVLEHVPDPERGVKIISECADDYFILSVPHEPIWRILNFIRGKYVKDFGNTPGHINHWSRRGFIKMVSQYADIIAYSCPLPWTMVLCKSKKL